VQRNLISGPRKILGLSERVRFLRKLGVETERSSTPMCAGRAHLMTSRPEDVGDGEPEAAFTLIARASGITAAARSRSGPLSVAS
jgi:hypothetical protein